MLKQVSKNKERKDRARRVRSKVSGTADRPRMVVYRSLRDLTVQVIDDTKGTTLVSARLGEVKGGKNTIDGARLLGALVGKKCKEANVGTVVFDRAGYRYHGKVKAIADGAREAGLIF